MRSLSNKLITVLSLCILGVVGPLVLLEYHAGQKLIDRQVEKTLHTIGERLSLSLRQSLYEMDRATTHDTILSEFTSEELRAILVWDDDGQHIVAGFGRSADGAIGEIDAAPNPEGLRHEHWLVRIASSRVPRGQLAVGGIDVYVDRAPLEKDLVNQLQINLVKILLTAGLILALLNRVLKRYLVLPLERIQRAMLETKTFFVEEKHDIDKVARLAEMLSENWSENAFSELQQMEQALREMVVAAHDRQEELRESENRNRTLVQACPDAIALTRTKDATLLDVNDATVLMFGYSREEIAATPQPTVLGVWCDSALREKFISALAENGRVDNLEADFYHKNGKVITALISARIIDFQGEDCHISFIRDISEIKAANLALEKSEAKFRKLSQEFEAVLNGLADALMLFDRDKQLVWGNRSALKEFGASQEMLVGSSCHKMWGPNEGVACETCIDEIFRTGQAA